MTIVVGGWIGSIFGKFYNEIKCLFNYVINFTQMLSRVTFLVPQMTNMFN